MAKICKLTLNINTIMPATPISSNLGLTPYKGAWTKLTTKHLLKRVLFGVKSNEIDYFLSKGMAKSVSELLSPNINYPSPPLNDYNTATVIDPMVPMGTTWINNITADGTLNSYRRSTFKKWQVGAMVNQEKNITEKLCLFWANHFSIEADIVSYGNYVFSHHDTLRKNCLGNFKQLIKLITIDAGMLRYLNGYLNTNTAPDENYGRELQELFTLGKHADVKYTEADVKAAAKVLTGWRINSAFNVYFDATKHDTTNKQFSSYYNNKIIAGKTAAAGATETDDLISMIFERPEVAKFICRKIYQFFVYYYIDDKIEKNIIAPLADIFIKNNFEIKPVLEKLFQSEHFYDSLYIGCQIKSPIEHVVGCLREFNISFPNMVTDYADSYYLYNNMVNQMINLGQNPSDPPNVAGWPAYYQVPEFYELWINADTLPKRNKFTDLMVESGYTRNGKKVAIDTISFAKYICATPSDPNMLIDAAFANLFSTDVSATLKANLKKQILLSGQLSDYYWTDAWNAYQASATTINFNIVNVRLKALLKYIMNLPEYQLQ
jgi:uncharacterized protein (DUF1800 family)